jgi:hypothetical protein
MAELTAGPGVVLSPSSGTNNFEFVTASRFERDALISVHGLPDIGAAERDVYLLVTTTNMPERVEPDRATPEHGATVAATHVPSGDGDGDGDGEADHDREAEYDPYATDLSGFDLVARDEPTYVV